MKNDLPLTAVLLRRIARYLKATADLFDGLSTTNRPATNLLWCLMTMSSVTLACCMAVLVWLVHGTAFIVLSLLFILNVVAVAYPRSRGIELRNKRTWRRLMWCALGCVVFGAVFVSNAAVALVALVSMASVLAALFCRQGTALLEVPFRAFTPHSLSADARKKLPAGTKRNKSVR